MANCPYCKQEIKYLNQTASYLSRIGLDGFILTGGREPLEQHYQCPECGEILSEDDLSEMVKPKLKPKAETAKQEEMELE